MQRLSGLSRRYLRQRRGRTALTGLGICLGVAVLFTTLIVITSIERGLDRMRVASAGMDVVGSPVGGGAGRTTVPDDAADTLARADGVAAVLRALAYRTDVAAADDPDTVHSFDALQVFGVDPDQVRRFFAVDGTEGPFLESTDGTEGRLFEGDVDEVVLAQRNAARIGVDVGDDLLVTLPQGRVPLRVTGLLDDRGLARRNDGQLLFTSLATARRLVGQPEALSSVALRLDEGVDPDAARQADAGVGGTVLLDTRTGWRRFEIAGTYTAVGSTRSGEDTAAVVMSQADGAAALGLTRTTQVNVRVAEAVDDLHDGSTTFWVLTADDWRGFYRDELDDFRAVLRSIILPAALLSALGLANTLAVAMLERRREIGVLRAVGLGRSQTRGLAIVEAGLQVGIAALLAVPLGFVLSRPAVAAAAAATGTVFDGAYPWRWLIWVAVLAFGLAVVASIAPAVRAARTDMSAALRFE